MEANTLEEHSLQHFDDLLRRGELLWTDTPPQLVKGSPFDIEFRIAPAYKQKPIQAEDAKGRSEDTNPFGDDDPAFTTCHIGSTHTLRLNKFCVVRPQFVLHTMQFEKQSDPLSLSDVRALWQALYELGQGKYAGIYNCGAQAGSSIGHKHMQILPKPDRALFPDDVLNSTSGHDEETSKHAEVPFEHAILPVTPSDNGDAIYSSYQRLYEHLKLVSGSPHNVFLTDAWIIVIPRIQARVSIAAANAASMLGCIWVKNEAELQAWKDYGPMKVLAEVGMHREVS